MSDIGSQIEASLRGTNGSSSTNFIDAAGNFAKGIGPELAQAVARSTAKYISDNTGTNISGLFDLATGTAINPNLAVLFRGPTLKSHSFSWIFSPRSATESQNIKRIIAIIKRAMHPSRQSDTSSAILKYPCECLIEFVGVKDNAVFLYPLRPVVVEELVVNYAPNQLPSFFQNSDEPTSLEITIQCQETSYYTRESFDNVALYGSDGFQTSDLTNSTNLGGASPFGASIFNGKDTGPVTVNPK